MIDLRALRNRVRSTIDGIPVLGRLLAEFTRIEFIDRCMLIAAQGLLALIPMLVVLAAFLPDVTDAALERFSDAAGLGEQGNDRVRSDVSIDQVRAQTGLVGLAITLFSATSFARAIQRMYERVWQQRHIGGVSGARRCFLWLLGWLMSLQVVAALGSQVIDRSGAAVVIIRFPAQCVLMSLIWWVSAWLLLFGRVAGRRLALGAVITGVALVLYTRGSGLVMPAYVRTNAEQFGTLGVILAISTWLIGLAAILVAGSLIGRVLSEDPAVRRVIKRTLGAAQRRLAPPHPGRPKSGDVRKRGPQRRRRRTASAPDGARTQRRSRTDPSRSATRRPPRRRFRARGPGG